MVMKLLVLFSLLTVSTVSFSQEKEIISSHVNKEKLPIPNEKNQLFYLQRDPDINTIIYVLNIQNGKLNTSNPVLSYWIRYADRGQTEKLTFIQRRMAYGISHKEIEPGIYELHLPAYKALKITLSENRKTGKYQALVKIEGNDIILNNIFVRITGGSFFKPNVQYIEISGNNLKSGKKVEHRVEL
jgi:hypothetical protein